MNSRKCPACQATVDALKAYCPDCGAAMDEELERSGSSEFDSMMRTQNISRTTQFRLMEDFNLSAVFNTKDLEETNGHRNGAAQISPNANNNQRRAESVVIEPQNVSGAATKKNEAVSNSGKKIYIYVGIGLAVFAFILIAAIVVGILVWNHSR